MANPKANATLSAPGHGSVDLYVTELHYDASLSASESQSRNNTTLYPKWRSGGWGIEIVHSSYFSYAVFNWWLAQYLRKITNPYLPTAQPMTLSVPSRSFSKTGFPETPAEFGDRFGQASWRQTMEFSSAAATIGDLDASRYRGATNDSSARYFYPGGTQQGELFNPITDPFADLEPTDPYTAPRNGPR